MYKLKFIFIFSLCAMPVLKGGDLEDAVRSMVLDFKFSAANFYRTTVDQARFGMAIVSGDHRWLPDSSLPVVTPTPPISTGAGSAGSGVARPTFGKILRSQISSQKSPKNQTFLKRTALSVILEDLEYESSTSDSEVGL